METHYELDNDGGRTPNVIKIIQDRNTVLSFTLRDYPEEHHKWLGDVLVSQVARLTENIQRNTTREIRENIKEALGL